MVQCVIMCRRQGNCFFSQNIFMTDSKIKRAQKKKGGARPGAGRKPLIGAKTTTVILTEDLLIQLKRLGGSSWIRSQIAATTKPSPTKVADELFNSLPIPAEEISVEKAPDNSMDRAGIHEGTVLFLRKKAKAQVGNIVLLEYAGKKTLRRLTASERGFRLVPESSDSGLTDFILPRGAELAHSGIVVYVLSEPK